MERHVDARHLDVGTLAAGDLLAAFDLLGERLQTAHRPGDCILRAAQVVVHDLQELTRPRGDIGDETVDVGVVEIDLRRPDRGQPVVRSALSIARDDVVHLAAAVIHHLDQRLEFVDAGDTGQCGVLADRVTAGDRAVDERTLLAHLGHLGSGDRGHGDLGELGQVQHTVGMGEVHTVRGQGGRVVAHHVQHRESERLAGEGVGTIPHLAGGLGPRPHLHTHALVLDALTGERIRRLGRGQPRGGRHHQPAADLGADLENLCAQVDSDPVHPEVHLVTR